ncbi:MAG: S8 family serine peptidase [Candidatus Heimdallarchaeota archaeon]
MNKPVLTRLFILVLFGTLLANPMIQRTSTSSFELPSPLKNTVKVNLTHGMVYSTYSSRVLGLQELYGPQWWAIRMHNEKDENRGLIRSPQIIIQTPLNWNTITSINPVNKTIDAGNERTYIWTRDYLVQGNNLNAKLSSKEKTEFTLPFDSSRNFSLGSISKKYVIGTLTVKIVPQIETLPNSILTITIDAGETIEVYPEILKHTFVLLGVNHIKPSNVLFGTNYLQFELEKWIKGQEICLQVDLRIKNRLYNPINNLKSSIRYVPGVYIAYTEREENIIEYTGSSGAFRITGLGKMEFSANGTYQWLTEGPYPHTTKVVRYQQISTPTEFFVEIGIGKYYLKKDMDPGAKIGDVYFEINTGNMTHPFRAPEPGYEERLYQTYISRPGPVFIPNQPQSLPIIATIKAFDRDYSEAENLTKVPQTITIESFEELCSNRPYIFNLTNIYFEIFIQPTTRIRDPFSRYQEPGVAQLTNSLPNDEFLFNQWYWFEIGADRIWTAYELNSFDTVIVAIIDTGVDTTHPDLQNCFLRDALGRIIGRNTIDNNGNVMDDSPTGHGTMMAGIIAAEINNSQFFAGIAPNVRIMPIKAVNEYGISLASDVAEGIAFAVDHGADIISVSVGSYLTSNVVGAAIRNAYDNNALVIAAVGNERTQKATIPAVYQETLSVTGVQRIDDNLVFADEFSNYGPDLTSSLRSPWVSAPAINIWSTNTTSLGNGTGIASGTSFATPMVSASVALILGYAIHKQIDITPDLIWWLLQASAIDLGPKEWDPYYGYGLVNVSGAIELLNLLGNVSISSKSSYSTSYLQQTTNSQRYLSLNVKTSEIELKTTKTINLKKILQKIEEHGESILKKLEFLRSPR